MDSDHQRQFCVDLAAPPEFLAGPEGALWRLVDGDYYCISDEDDSTDEDDHDPIEAQLLWQRSVAIFNRRTVSLTPEQRAKMRSRLAAEQAARAREERRRQRDQETSSASPEPKNNRRPRARRQHTSAASPPPTGDSPEDPAGASVTASSSTVVTLHEYRGGTLEVRSNIPRLTSIPAWERELLLPHASKLLQGVLASSEDNEDGC